jgi:hypothetical protein
MRLDLYGGFGEKGRTCLGVESAGFRLLLDAGVKTSAHGRDDYYPAIDRNSLESLDAIIVTHAHEDHVAALGWCIAGGFRGRIFMTAECRREADTCLASYATAAEHALARSAAVEVLPVGEDGLTLGPFHVSTGRSGHMGGSVWCSLTDNRVRLCYCGDIVPSSKVFAMDPIARADAIVIDASYGEDATTVRRRAKEVAEWIAAHPRGGVMPTPLYGRSLELLALVDGPLALAPGMREALRTQIAGDVWLVPGTADLLTARLAASFDWQFGDPLPPATLLCHDGMGMSGPSRAILAEAARVAHPTLFTGHLPAGSPGEEMVERKRASWIRLPTHPTLTENLALVASSGAARVLGHSCDSSVLDELKAHLRQLDAKLATGDRVLL